MAKSKSKEIPFISDEEIEELVKPVLKNSSPKRKKPIEKIAEPIKPEPLPKPVKKTVKKLQEKIVKDIKKIEPEKIEKVELPIKTPDIEYVLRSTTKFDFNYYYLKEKLMKVKRWILSPYRLYEVWFNKTFNNLNYVSSSQKQVIQLNEGIDYETLKDLFENIPEKEKEIHHNIDKEISKRTIDFLLGDKHE